jgi:hypothetical protein
MKREARRPSRADHAANRGRKSDIPLDTLPGFNIVKSHGKTSGFFAAALE